MGFWELGCLWHLLPRVCCSFLHFLECAGELADEVMLPARVIVIHQELRRQGGEGRGERARVALQWFLGAGEGLQEVGG